MLLLVAPNDRRVRIEVGYGLEGTLTDALSKLIIANAIVPRFKAGDFAGGIARGVDDIITVLTTDASEWQKRPVAAARPPARAPAPPGWLLDRRLVRLRHALLSSRPASAGFVGNVLLGILLSAAAAAGGRRLFRRRQLVGGGGGGGFSGGGGSSGGGGASGSW